MRKSLSFVVFVVLVTLPMCAGRCGAEELKRISLDDVAKLGLRIETDATVKVEGKSSIKITTLWPTTVCLGEVDSLDVENATLTYAAQVRTDMKGSVVLELWAHVGNGQYFSRSPNAVAAGKSEWNKLETPFLIQRGQNPEKVTLNLVINGMGTVWIDDITLSKESL